MKDFIAIDFETANPQRVSACAVGFTKVLGSEIVESNGYLIKPVGGHNPFQSKIHGIKEEHTFDKPEFGELFSEIRDIFNYPLVGHSLFDKQVLNALSNHFDLGLTFEYIDSSTVAKNQLADVKNCKLNTLVKYFGLPAFKHHDATEDSIACANIYLKLLQLERGTAAKDAVGDENLLKGLILGVLADDDVSYKETYALLYWLEDHPDVAQQHINLYLKTKEVLDDDYLDALEAEEMRHLLFKTLAEI